jgi:hypothetical protein
MSNAKQRHRPWGRIVAGAIGAAILFVAVAALVSSHEQRRDADAALIAEPVHLKVDISKPGQFSGEFRQTFRAACTGYLQIVPESLPSSEKEALSLLKGLRGHFSIVSHDGAVAYERGFGSAGFVAIPVEKDRWVPALERGRFSFDKGVYEIRGVVDHGAPALAGVPHSLVARYGLCGLEYVPAQILSLIGIIGCVIAGLILLPVALITISDRFLSEKSEAGENAPPTD